MQFDFNEERIRKLISDISLLAEGKEIHYEIEYEQTQQQRFVNKGYKYLFDIQNKYRLLYQYLQNSKDFIQFQVDEKLIPSYWILITILDSSFDDQPVKYLYGPSANDSRILPSFLFRAFYTIGNTTQEDQAVSTHRLGTVASSIRHVSKTDQGYKDLSDLSTEIVYVPNAAIDYHVLKWCLDYLTQKNVKFLEGEFEFFPQELYTAQSVDDSVFDKLTNIRSRKKNIQEWMTSWGLVTKSDTGYGWTARGTDLLSELNIKSLNFEVALKSLLKKSIEGRHFVNEANSFQKEIHFMARFRQEIQTPRGILRFSHPDFQFRGKYVIYLNIVVEENLGPDLKITQERISDKNDPIGKRFNIIQQVYKPLMAIEYDRVFIGKLIPNYEERIIKKSIRSATSAIALRNSSHNIGSHVLSTLVTKESTENLIHEARPKKRNEHGYFPLKDLAQNKKNSYDVWEYIAYFYSYLKTRMDFLADIATGTPSLENPRFFIEEVIAGIDKNRILLNRISGTHNFRYSFYIKDCRECIHGETICECPKLSPDTDFPVSMVNDILGQHALYVIIENIIRNTAKHAVIPKGRNVIFTISVNECPENSEFYRLLIYDNCSISDTRLNQLVTDQNKRLNESILQPDNTLRNGNWGLIEMVISAAYLRKIDAEDIEKPVFKIPITADDELKYVADENRARQLILKALKKGNHLAYQFYIPKPKEILIYDQSGVTWKNSFIINGKVDESRLKFLESQGIAFLHGSSDAKVKDWRLMAETSYTHQIMILLTSTNTLEDSFLPKRVITESMLSKSFNEYAQYDLGYVDRAPLAIADLVNHPKVLREEAWRCWISEKMLKNEITQISPYEIYSKFIKGKPDYSSDFVIVPDDHAKQIETRVREMELGEINFYQDFNHLTKDFIDMTFPYEEESGRIKVNFDFGPLFKFIEGAMTNVLIIDERIQQNFIKKHPKIKKEIGKVAEMSLIYSVPLEFLNLSSQTYPKNCRQKLSEFISKMLPENSKIKGISIIVIHIGVIEKFLKTERKGKDRNSIRDFVNTLKDEVFNIFKVLPTVVITSGRGKPDNLPEDIPFLGYSILSQYAIENRFKSHLTEALLSARPKK